MPCYRRCTAAKLSVSTHAEHALSSLTPERQVLLVHWACTVGLLADWLVGLLALSVSRVVVGLSADRLRRLQRGVQSRRSVANTVLQLWS